MTRDSKVTGESTKQGIEALQSRLALNKRLLNYALAAGAAGAGLIGAGPAKAEVVYTPANISITGGHGLLLDLNHDGTSDFFFANEGHSYISSLLVNGLHPGNQVAELNASPIPLPRGIRIGSQWKFAKSAVMAVDSYGYLRQGPWANVTHHCLGLEFEVNGQEYYGWAEFSVVSYGVQIKATLEGYAYNNVPGQSILTGQTSGTSESSRLDRVTTAPASALRPPTLGILALGSIGLDLWRKEEPRLSP